MRQKNRRIMAAGMAAVTLCTSLVSAPVYAAEASVSIDEAMYVNLDYYGSVDKVNVVKGVSLNGLTSFTDYGNYLDVTNMTNNTAPEISDGKATWNLPAAASTPLLLLLLYSAGIPIVPLDLTENHRGSRRTLRSLRVLPVWWRYM